MSRCVVQIHNPLVGIAPGNNDEWLASPFRESSAVRRNVAVQALNAQLIPQLCVVKFVSDALREIERFKAKRAATPRLPIRDCW